MSNTAPAAATVSTTPSSSSAPRLPAKSAPQPAPKPALKSAAKLKPAVKPVASQAATAKPAAPTAAKPKAKAISAVPSKAVVAKATVARKVPLAKPAAPKAPAKVALTTATKLVKNVKKPKLVRDSFTIPKAEYTVLDDLKQRAATLAQSVKKSELLRAGIKALAAMSDAAFLNALGQVPAIKTGRPAAGN